MFYTALCCALPLGLAHADFEELDPVWADDSTGGKRFGRELVFQDGTLLVGAVGDPSQPGSVYVFAAEDAGGWSRVDSLEPEAPANFDSFGASLALDGDAALVGAPTAGFPSGSATVFARESGAWAPQQTLMPGEGEVAFGTAVAIGGDLALVSSQMNGDGVIEGLVSVFRWNADAAWDLDATLSSGDLDDGFGASLATDGTTVIVGAPAAEVGGGVTGAVYVFEFASGSWEIAQALAAEGLAEGARFGAELALQGDRLLVGAPSQVGLAEGLAYVFVHTGSSWELEDTLLPEAGSGAALFGGSLALSGDGDAVVGAPGSQNGAGAAYLFSLEGDDWVPGEILVASAGQEGDLFGQSVARAGLEVLIGAPGRTDPAVEDGLMAGAVYRFVEPPDEEPESVRYYLSPRNPLVAQGVAADDEDVLAYDPELGSYALVFDGSAFGLQGNGVDALDVLEDGSLLLSFRAAAMLPELGVVLDQDVVHFAPAGSGAAMEGTFSAFFVGGTHRLFGMDVDVDAFAQAPEGLLFSPPNTIGVDGFRVKNEDVFYLESASDAYAPVFNGSRLGLTFENLDALERLDDGSYLMSFDDMARVPGVGVIEDEDVVRFVPSVLGFDTAGSFELFFEGDTAGLVGDGTDVDAFAVR